MEVTIASRCDNSFYSTKSKDKVEFKMNVKFSKNTTKETCPPLQVNRFLLQESLN